MQNEETSSEEYFVLRKIDDGYVGTDGTRFLRLAIHDDLLSSKVTRFNSPEAASTYAREIVRNRFAVQLVKVFVDYTAVDVDSSVRA